MATDFRSDTVTRPSDGMRAVMAAAPVGDDVFGDDPSVNALEAEVADLLGFESGLFVPSGTQSNLIGIMAHCARGDEYIVGQKAHTYRYEAGGAAGPRQRAACSRSTMPPTATIPVADIEAAIKARRCPFWRPHAPDRARRLHRRAGAACRLCGDGSRPGGSSSPLDASRRRALVERRSEARGRASNHRARLRFGIGLFVERPRRAGWVGAVRQARFRSRRTPMAQDAGRRHAPGGNSRCSGAVCVDAQHNAAGKGSRQRNAVGGRAGEARRTDHRSTPQTNMIFVDVPPTIADALAAHLASRGIQLTGTTHQRWVTHLDVTADDVDRAVAGGGQLFRDDSRGAVDFVRLNRVVASGRFDEIRQTEHVRSAVFDQPRSIRHERRTSAPLPTEKAPNWRIRVFVIPANAVIRAY